MDSVMVFFDQALTVLSNVSLQVTGVAAMAYDFVRRTWPTSKAASLPGDIVAVVRKVLALVSKLVDVLSKAADLVDGIVGNNTKQEAKTETK